MRILMTKRDVEYWEENLKAHSFEDESSDEEN